MTDAAMARIIDPVLTDLIRSPAARIPAWI